RSVGRWRKRTRSLRCPRCTADRWRDLCRTADHPSRPGSHPNGTQKQSAFPLPPATYAGNLKRGTIERDPVSVRCPNNVRALQVGRVVARKAGRDKLVHRAELHVERERALALHLAHETSPQHEQDD
uniref:Uncharacterized protein n=1 Tax=Anopheles atroparvus TaxID=41427 RepID=A0AAG5DRP7_ANOAO